MTRAFTHEGHPARVLFERGAVTRVAEEVDRLGTRRAFVIGNATLGGVVAEMLGARLAALHSEIVMHVPVETARAARERAMASGADGLVAIGGGSAVGLAKAIARDTGLPIIALPTSYAGSEMTSIWGLTEGGEKTTGRDPKVRPKTVIYDPDLTASMPVPFAACSGLNALAHAMEALYARNVDPIVQLMAEESVRALATGLTGLVAEPKALEPRAETFYGAWRAGGCLDRATMGLHHKLCHVLGGSFRLPHAQVHSVVLPYVAAYNRDAAPDAMRRLARALNGDDAPGALFALARRVGAPASLAELGLQHADLDRVAALVTERPYDNPRPVEPSAVRALLESALLGAAVTPA